jgi:4-hydroxyphenylacetate 3-monooxygenase
MLRTGSDYLEAAATAVASMSGSSSARPTHPAFRNTARSFSTIHDRKRSPEHLDVMSCEENGERYTSWFQTQSRDDLRKRSETHRRVAEWSYGLLGRSPDHVASFIVGLALHPELFEANRKGFGDHLQAYYDELRRRDLFACYVVAAPQTSRNPELYNREVTRAPSLQVTGTSDRGVILNGAKMLGTAAVFSDEIWVGNLLPLAPDQKTYAEAIRQSGLSLLALIEDILDFSKIESGALTLESSDVLLRPLIEGVAELLARTSRFPGSAFSCSTM